nr:unnamed protein product [Digitaria exilis]
MAAVNCLYVAAASTAASAAALQWWASSLLDGGAGDGDWLGAVLRSRVTVALLANLAAHVFLVIILALKVTLAPLFLGPPFGVVSSGLPAHDWRFSSMKFCVGFCSSCDSKLFWLLFFEPLSIAFDTLQALIASFLKRIKTYIKLRKALSSLDGALPDATYDEICAYDDECAICRVGSRSNGRGAGLDASWAPPWSSPGMNNPSSSSAVRSVGLTGVQMMMRQLASVTDNYGHADGTWNLWTEPMAGSSLVPSTSSIPDNASASGLRLRGTAGATRNGNLSEVLTMVDRVREVLPHIPDELIIEDLMRTNNINATVNNLLLMQ